MSSKDDGIHISTLPKETSTAQKQVKVFLSQVIKQELGIKTLVDISKKYKVNVKDQRDSKNVGSLIATYQKNQDFMELKKLIGDFQTIIDILKINKIDQSKT